ncbi:hypothetical protein, partial [Alkalilimnicola ehrlichii]|uniref:hypothetical protein n=1 Tax=Alkalilimnicola ehrlichii TaxID=351052 RepID=UPI001C6F5B9C
ASGYRRPARLRRRTALDAGGGGVVGGDRGAAGGCWVSPLALPNLSLGIGCLVTTAKEPWDGYFGGY